jgi:hypothetical protein
MSRATGVYRSLEASDGREEGCAAYRLQSVPENKHQPHARTRAALCAQPSDKLLIKLVDLQEISYCGLSNCIAIY